MSFLKKIWVDRVSEHPNRRILTNEDNTTNIVTVERDEGIISQQGDAFSATNMNDLEDRVEAGFNEINNNLTWKEATLTIDKTYGDFYPSNQYNAWYRYDSAFIEIRIRGTYVTKLVFEKGKTMCRVSGLPIAIPRPCYTMVWDATAQGWRTFLIETNGSIKLDSNASIPPNSWLSNDTTNFIIYR